MLTAKQEILTRLAVAHIRAYEDELTPVRTMRLKVLADYIIDYGADTRPFVHPPETPLSGLGFGKRSQACLVTILRENGLAERWEDAKDLEVSVVAPLVFEEVLVTMRNVGANTIKEIKRGFGLCGIYILAHRPEVEEKVEPVPPTTETERESEEG